MEALAPEVKRRLFDNVYVCKKCKSKIRANHLKILAKEVTCPKCGSKAFRPKKFAKKK